MTSNPTISIVVVSRGRPTLLPVCLTAIGQLYYPNFEVVVVGDPGACQAVEDMGWADKVKRVAYDEANISKARNLGIAQAAGEVVAFIDDDAVPEPTWLDYLAGAFVEDGAGAAGGYVRGRDGISFQWKANLVDPAGRPIELDAAGKESFSPGIPEGFGIKTEGTNCAFRRDILAEIGGFDPSFRFFHDDTDLNMRLTRQDVKTVLVPSAQVHHSLAASQLRGADRAPRSLFEIGASQMLFLRKWCPPIAHETSLGMFRGEQRKRMLRAMVNGGIEPRDVERLMRDLEDGLRDGAIRDFESLEPIGPPARPFLPFQRASGMRKPVFIAGRAHSLGQLRKRARQRVEEGHVVTILQLYPSARAHRVAFDREGYWLQRGGLYGRSIESETRFRYCRFGTRVRRELSRVAYLRQSARIDGKPGGG